MDKLAERLHRDAENIEARISEQLDDRIRASLESVAAENRSTARPRRQRPATFWLASSLTGVAAAVAVIAVINLRQPGPSEVSSTPDNLVTDLPIVDLKVESAMLTGPLRDELEDLQSDLRKAEEKVKSDIGL